MTQLFDVRGNPWTGSLDAIGGETVTDARAATASLVALNATQALDINGKAAVSVDLRSGASTCTVVFEATVDGVNYVALSALQGSVPITSFSPFGVANTQIIVAVTGYRSFRVRVSAYTSGSLTVAMRATLANYAITSIPLPATLCTTTTGVAGAAVTLTIPAGQAGLFHYITRLTVQRFFSSAGLAAATPTIVTSGNLPGPLAFSFPTAGALGTMVSEVLEPAQPLKTNGAATVTTIICPAVADTIWRVTAQYLLGG